jgi:hypothetical protein
MSGGKAIVNNILSTNKKGGITLVDNDLFHTQRREYIS